VGNADRFVESLKGVGITEFERVRMDQVDPLAADFKKR
jgi:hypothetical protein